MSRKNEDRIVTRELLVLRHGQAVDHDPDGDFARHLTDKGKRDAQRMGVYLARHQLLPDDVVSSRAERAKTTSQKCLKSAGLSPDLIRYDGRIWESNMDAILELLRQTTAETRRLLLVGHHPGLTRVLHYIATNMATDYDRHVALSVGTLGHLRFDAQWSDLAAACGRCVGLIQPNELPKTFPYPNVDGVEQRIRPAYYYRQSSVIPYRIGQAGIEVLMVSSSKKKHWVVPKGIHDPGKTAQASAANEALEEAGVVGEVSPTEIGRYSYGKWDATCTVTVYPMKVTRELPEQQWEERHRGRKWLPVDAAAELVRNDDLTNLILKLPEVLSGVVPEKQ